MGVRASGDYGRPKQALKVGVVAVVFAAFGCARQSSPAPAAGTSAVSTSAAAAPLPRPETRRRELERVIDANVGHAHLVRGMNRDTIEALDRACSPADLPILGELLLSEDRVHAMTAAEVLALRGAVGRAELESAAAKVKQNDPERFLLIDERLRSSHQAETAPDASAAMPLPAPVATPAPAAPDTPSLASQAKEEFRAFVASRQSCSASTDCSIISGSCPFDCYVPAAKASAAAVSAKLAALGERLDKAGNRCVYRCMSPPVPACVSGRCAAGER